MPATVYRHLGNDFLAGLCNVYVSVVLVHSLICFLLAFLFPNSLYNFLLPPKLALREGLKYIERNNSSSSSAIFSEKI